jgi:hypothetical protein
VCVCVCVCVCVSQVGTLRVTCNVGCVDASVTVLSVSISQNTDNKSLTKQSPAVSDQMQKELFCPARKPQTAVVVFH